MTDLDPASAVALLQRGGVLAYPTEAVWGLGCAPFDADAVHRLLAIKRRPVEKGLILVGGDVGQFEALVDWDALPAARRDAVRASWPGPHTWVVPVAASVPVWITGGHGSLAVRVSAHPGVAALCAHFGGPIVSTSANLAGEPPAFHRAELSPALLAVVDGVCEGDTGGLEAPTAIRDARTGAVLRG
jgi:L-threonylcarbamoyladenylate synthase